MISDLRFTIWEPGRTGENRSLPSASARLEKGTVHWRLVLVSDGDWPHTETMSRHLDDSCFRGFVSWLWSGCCGLMRMPSGNRTGGNRGNLKKEMLPRKLSGLVSYKEGVALGIRALIGKVIRLLLVLAVLAWITSARAVVLWSDLGETLVQESGIGRDILGGAVKRDYSSTNVLYFKFHVDPRSDVSTEEYFAAFELFEKGEQRLAVGNALKAWAYSAFNTSETGESNTVSGDMDLHSSQPEPSGIGALFPYEFPRRGNERTIVFKVQYVGGKNDLVTVWLNPDLSPGATEAGQPESLTTTFKANASFDEIHLRHGGGGKGWTFSDMAIATSFNDLLGGRGSLPFSFRSWQREQGLPQNSVRALAQTIDGYIWAGSDEGVVRFDGVRFDSFGFREKLRSGPVRTLFGDSTGALWIGSAGGGLIRWQAGQFTTFTMRDKLPSESITALAEDSAGRLWVGTEAGLVVYENGHLAPLNAALEIQGKPITALFKDWHGIMWVGAAGAGVFQVVAGKFIPLTDSSVEGLLRDSHCLLVDQAARVWVGAGDDFVLCREGMEWHRYRIPRHLARPYVSALAEEPDGTVWAGSVSEGLFQFKVGKLTPIDAGSGLSDNLVESLLIDREGKLWVGTDAGLNRLRRKTLSAFGQTEDDLGYGTVQGLAEVAPGVIWAGKPSDGLFRGEGRNFNRLMPTGFTRGTPQVNSLLTGNDGSCWVGCSQGLLHFKDPKTSANETEPLALAGLDVISLADDREGGVWAGTREGSLWRLQEKKWLAHSNPWHGRPITAIVQDTDGSTWIGTEGDGIYRLKSGMCEHLGKEGAGLLSDLIHTLYLDAHGTLWIGTAGGGLSQYRAGRIKTLTTREGLPDDTISQILEDDSGRLWLGSNRGIACVSRSELDQFGAGKIPAVYPQVFGLAEGMLSEECTGGFYPAGLKTKSGLLWFATLKGVVVANPQAHLADSPAPTVVIEEVLLDGIPVHGFWGQSSIIPNPAEKVEGAESEPKPLRIPPGKHRLELRYTGMSFNAPERVRFRYRLEGLDPDWVEPGDAGTRRTASYSYVPPGDYRFRVIACNSDGIWNQTGADLTLKVLPHFWQAWWFVGLAAIGLLVTVGSSARLVEKAKGQRRLRHLEQEQALERERARIARDLHDDLGSSLTRISLLSGLAKADKENPRQVEAHMNKISQSAEQTVRALEEIVWAVRPGSDSLQSLVEYIAHFANELFEGDGGTRCRLDLPHNLPARTLPPDVRHNIFLVVKEALTNALKHASAGEVRVQAKVFANALEIIIQDDGLGFDPVTPPGGGERNGLGNMRRRAEGIGAKLTVLSAPRKGTTVSLILNFPTLGVATAK